DANVWEAASLDQHESPGSGSNVASCRARGGKKKPGALGRASCTQYWARRPRLGRLAAPDPLTAVGSLGSTRAKGLPAGPFLLCATKRKNRPLLHVGSLLLY